MWFLTFVNTRSSNKYRIISRKKQILVKTKFIKSTNELN